MLDSRHVCRSRSRRTNYCRRFCRCSTTRRFDQLGLLVVRRIQRSSSVWLDCWTSVYCGALWNTFLTPLRLSKRRQGCFALHLWGIIIVACVQPAKVLNSVLGNGILPSGGDTKYVFVGSYGIGVPVVLLSAFILRLSVWGVFGSRALEEVLKTIFFLMRCRTPVWYKKSVEELSNAPAK
jgi:hypothetical protein